MHRIHLKATSNPRSLLCAAVLLLLTATPARTDTVAVTAGTPETFVRQLLQHYARITTVSCDVRRDVETPEGNIRWLSRVYYAPTNRLHAANAAPLPRLIIADGETMFQHTAGQPRGFRRPIADLDPNMLINLQRVPGTLMEYLLRLQDAPEQILDPTPEGHIRRAYDTGQIYAVLEADPSLRLQRIRFFDAANRDSQTAEIICEGFEQVLPDVWIPMRHQATVQFGEHTVRERTRFSNYQANQPLPPDIFQADKHYADNIEWVDSFDQL